MRQAVGAGRVRAGRLAAFVAMALLLVAGWWSPAAVRAQDLVPVPPLSGRVVDLAGALTPAQAEALSAKLAAIETARGSQVVVLVVPTTKPEDITDFTQRVGEQWKLGRKAEGDGLLIVVARDDRRVRIAPARALEGAIPDVAARRIIAEQMAPAFRNNDWAGGLNAAVDRIDERIAGEALPAPVEQRERRGGGTGGFDLQDLLLFFFIGVPVVGSFIGRIVGRKTSAVLTAGVAGAAGWWITTSLLVALGVGAVALLLVGLSAFGGGGRRGGFGGGPIIWGGGGGGGGWGGGGGGFSSGGGGDFSGGGASGDW